MQNKQKNTLSQKNLSWNFGQVVADGLNKSYFWGGGGGLGVRLLALCFYIVNLPLYYVQKSKTSK